MEAHWYYAVGDAPIGPLSFDELVSTARSGQLARNALVWSTGMSDWRSASEINGLWPLPPPLPPENDRAFAHVVPAAQPGRRTLSAGTEPITSQPRAVSHSGWIARHWKGQLSLAKSYWLVGVLLSFALVGATHALGYLMANANLSPVTGGIVGSSTILTMIAIVVWQLVGIWRSAGNHMRATKRRFWAILARIAVVVGVARALAEFTVVTGPLLSESLKQASGRDDTPAHALRILRSGTEVELAGGMPFGTADALSRLLDAAPAVTVVHLNSSGGRETEGYQLYKLIRERRLATYTASNCVSACTIAFLGGTDRLLSTNARLGFHSLSIGGIDQTHLPEINNDLRSWLASRGVPTWFVDRALSTPAASMWYPEVNELISAKIVTRVVDADQFAMSGIADWRNDAAFERALLETPLFGIIRQNDPAGFAKVSERFAHSIRLGKTEAEITADTQAVLAEILPAYLRVAPDGVLERYWRTQVDEMEHLLRLDASLCVEFLFPERRRPSFNLRKYIPSEMLSRDLAALTELVGQAIQFPQRAQPNPNIDAELRSVVERVEQRFPGAAAVIAEPEQQFNNPTALCRGLSQFYAEVLRLPAAQSGPILRLLMQRI